MKPRLLSLDILRGLTVACMILVNNGYGASFAPLGHSKWNGMTPCDLVFPFFLFMVGASIYISMSRHAGEPGMVRKILRRTLLMFVIGVALHAWDMLISGEAAQIPGHLRIWGVLQRIALSYCLASLFFNAFKGRYLWHAIITLLIIYGIILIVGNGYSEVSDENWLARVDKALFGNHLYAKCLDGRSPVDPEGLVGVIAGTAHALLGVVCGRAIMTGRDLGEKVRSLLIIAAYIGLVGYLLSFAFPLNKRIWSPSYTLVPCSMGASLLALLTHWVDSSPAKEDRGGLSSPFKGDRGGLFSPFQWFGLNALGIYVISEMIPSVFKVTGISDAIYSLWSTLFCWTIPEVASLFYALTYVALMGLLAWWLFKKKIYIKI